MPRIIPAELNRKLRREYRMRFLSVFFLVCSLAIFACLLLVSSSYLLLSLYERAYANGDSGNRNEEIAQLNESFNAKVNLIHALIQKIPSPMGGIDIQIADTLFGYAGDGLEINSIEILPEDGVSRITLRGTSATRDSLLQFQNKIKLNPSFHDFNIPIEALTKQKDITFNVTFTYNEN